MRPVEGSAKASTQNEPPSVAACLGSSGSGSASSGSNLGISSVGMSICRVGWLRSLQGTPVLTTVASATRRWRVCWSAQSTSTTASPLVR